MGMQLRYGIWRNYEHAPEIRAALMLLLQQDIIVIMSVVMNAREHRIAVWWDRRNERNVKDDLLQSGRDSKLKKEVEK